MVYSRGTDKAIALPTRIRLNTDNSTANSVLEAFINVGLVGASQALAHEAYDATRREGVTKHHLESAAKRAFSDALEWGAVAGVYEGMQIAIERVRERRDWVNAAVAGGATGAIFSLRRETGARTNNHIVTAAITGAAVSTAAEFLRQL
eukprot:TRINITY_DN54_c0_g1_i2.p1 TRINITY_DN54_c0_g1~~TRINITY_DN54_c0_g1_i2.p1  ORF type:complete len:149 (+),score=18.09 TRINITY_DN54_c0_g1_i2:121-567(+)